MAHSYVDARLQAHGYLLAHGMLSDKFLTIGTPHGCLLIHTDGSRMLSDKFLTIGTPSDNNNSIERTPTAHRCLLIHTDTFRQ